jgi:Translation initiation factor 2 (IF-2; GTPase)
MMVAVNKIDKEEADPERVKNELARREVIPDECGGDVQFISVSAHSAKGIDALLDAVLLQAELLELTAVHTALARGTVVESRLDRGRGPVATVLVQNGLVRVGDAILVGEQVGKVRALVDENGKQTKEAGPHLRLKSWVCLVRRMQAMSSSCLRAKRRHVKSVSSDGSVLETPSTSASRPRNLIRCSPTWKPGMYPT